MVERLEIGEGTIGQSKLVDMLTSTSISSKPSNKNKIIQVIHSAVDPLDKPPDKHAPDKHAPDKHAPDKHAPHNKHAQKKSISVVEDDSSDSDQGGMDDVDGGIDSLPPPIHESIKEALGKGKREKETKPPEAPEGPSLMEEMMREAEEERKKKEQIERKKEAKRAKKVRGWTAKGMDSQGNGQPRGWTAKGMDSQGDGQPRGWKAKGRDSQGDGQRRGAQGGCW